jgi:hypothetical protein
MVFISDEWHQLARGYNKQGYVQHVLAGPFTVRIAPLVLEAFVEPRPHIDMEACHWDGDKTNNWLDNLYWGTAIQNAMDRRRHGRERPFASGEANPSAKLTAAAVIEIRERINCGETIASLINRFGVSRKTIQNIRAGKVWKHVA